MAREKGMGSLQLEKSGRWTVRFCIDGKRVSRSARTKDRQIAERLLMRILAPLGRGEKRLALADVWHYYLVSPNRRELSKATLDNKRFVWMHFASWIEQWHPEVAQLAHITAEMIAEYLVELRNDHTASTYNGRVCVLREIFHVLADRAGLVEDAWSGVRLHTDDSHSRRELTMDELKRLISESEKVKVKGEEVWSLLIQIGLYTGLRLGDCCLLRWSEVDLERGVIQLVPRKTKRHANGVPITIPIHPTLLKLLPERCRTDADSDYVLPAVAELYASARWRVSERLSRIFKAAGIRMQVPLEGRKRLATEASFHSLRHTFVSLAANAGVPLSVIASIVGHTSTAMTRHYYHEHESALRNAISAIPTVKCCE